MPKHVPTWVFLICMLIFGILSIVFGWVVMSVTSGSNFGTLGDVSILAASFPELVNEMYEEYMFDADRFFRVSRNIPKAEEYQPIRAKADIRLQGLILRSDKAALLRASGWRLIVGTFMLDGKLQHAVLALAPDLSVAHIWKLKDNPANDKASPVFPHGFAIMKDGSVIFTFDGGTSIQRIDQCGRLRWSTSGAFNHTVSLEDDQKYAWTIEYTLMKEGDFSSDDPNRPVLVRISTESGKIDRRIPIQEIIAANPDSDILNIRQNDDWNGESADYAGGKYLFDPFHLNDVEPLPAAYADHFPTFSAGDLLISARSLNLIFVVSPQTLAIKWWHSGSWRRQHDPDWQPNGEITVLDNNRDRQFSRIVAIDPMSNKTRPILDGRNFSFYTPIRGKHQFTAAGDLLVTSAQQGRVFELDPSGSMVFELFNTKPETAQFNYLISEAMWLPLDSLAFDREDSCKK